MVTDTVSLSAHASCRATAQRGARTVGIQLATRPRANARGQRRVAVRTSCSASMPRYREYKNEKHSASGDEDKLDGSGLQSELAASMCEAKISMAGPVDGPDYDVVTRNLALELVRVTEAAAIQSGRWMGRGGKVVLQQVNALQHVHVS